MGVLEGMPNARGPGCIDCSPTFGCHGCAELLSYKGRSVRKVLAILLGPQGENNSRCGYLCC